MHAPKVSCLVIVDLIAIQSYAPTDCDAMISITGGLSGWGFDLIKATGEWPELYIIKQSSCWQQEKGPTI